MSEGPVGSDTESRSSPESVASSDPGHRLEIVVVILAAGASSRMLDGHKLLKDFKGRPLVGHAATAALGCSASSVLTVVGHRAEEVAAAMPDDILTLRNPDPARGLASSLKIGIEAVPPGADGALILLGDMPLVTAEDCDALIRAASPDRIVVPQVDGRRGNPVLWHRSFFREILGLAGDRGAREIIERYPDRVTEVVLHNRGLLIDIDTQAELERARQQS